MAGKVRIIAGPRNVSFDHYIEDVIAQGAWETEFEYFGIEDEDRANYIRKKLRMAGQHMDPRVAVKAYYRACNGCQNGGPSCRFHVLYSAYDMDVARAYKQRIAEASGMKRRQMT